MTSNQQNNELVLKFLWERFRDRLKWPSYKECILSLSSEAVESALNEKVVVRRYAGDDDVFAAFDNLIRLSDVRELFDESLAPLLREAAAVYVQNVSSNGNHEEVKFPFSKMKRFWTDPMKAQLAAETIRSTRAFDEFKFGGSDGTNNTESYWFVVHLEILRVEHVSSFEDYLSISRTKRDPDTVRYPSGKHLELIRRIYAFSKKEQQWPLGLQFAVAARDVGFVPNLVSDLSSRFIRGSGFYSSPTHRLVLTPQALPLLDQSGEDRSLFTKIVREIVAIWSDSPSENQVEIALAQLAGRLNVDTEALGPVAAFLEWSGWCAVTHSGGDEQHGRLVFAPTFPEAVLRFKGLDKFEVYLDALESDERKHQEPFGISAAAPSVQSQSLKESVTLQDISLLFLKNETYRRVIEGDIEELRRTLAAEAWKSSLILIGGVIEGVLLDVLSRREDKTQGHLSKGSLKNASLIDLINAAEKLGLLQPPVRTFAEAAKDYRNLTHPYRAAISLLRPDKASVQAILHAMDLVLSDLRAAYQDGRISKFEST